VLAFGIIENGRSCYFRQKWGCVAIGHRLKKTPFSIIPRLTPTDFWPRNGLHQKSKNMNYGKKTYVGSGL
jgi:hypothetical protein